MNQTPQMIAIIRTLLYFMGKQMYMPSANDVLPILNEALASQPLVDPKSAPLSWSVGTTAAPSMNSNMMRSNIPLKQQRA